MKSSTEVYKITDLNGNLKYALRPRGPYNHKGISLLLIEGKTTLDSVESEFGKDAEIKQINYVGSLPYQEDIEMISEEELREKIDFMG